MPWYRRAMNTTTITKKWNRKWMLGGWLKKITKQGNVKCRSCQIRVCWPVNPGWFYQYLIDKSHWLRWTTGLQNKFLFLLPSSPLFPSTLLINHSVFIHKGAPRKSRLVKQWKIFVPHSNAPAELPLIKLDNGNPWSCWKVKFLLSRHLQPSFLTLASCSK